MTEPKRIVRALCCGCGNLAEFGSVMKLRGKHAGSGPHVTWDSSPHFADIVQRGREVTDEDYARCVIQRYCPVCGEATTHAFLRDRNGHEDHLEQSHLDHLGMSQWPDHVLCTYCQEGMERALDQVAERLRARSEGKS